MGRRRGKEIRIYAELRRVLLYHLNNAGVSCCAEAAAAKASTSAKAEQVSKTFSYTTVEPNFGLQYISDRPLKFNSAQRDETDELGSLGGTPPLI